MLSNGVQKDQKYENLLMEIIRIQRKLLDCRFIWNERRRMPAPKKRFWKRISEEELQYNTYLNELDELKEKARFHCREAGYSDGIQWWSLPWEQTEEYLIFDLEVLSDHDNWRFEQTWRPVAVNNAEVLTLREEGHCSLFSSQKVKGDQLISA